MIREIIKTMLQPIKAVLSIFDDDAHKIISKRGIEALEEQKTKIDSIHDVSNICQCSSPVFKTYEYTNKPVCTKCRKI